MIKVIIDLFSVIVEIGLLYHFYNSFFKECRLNKGEKSLLFFILGILAVILSNADIGTTQRMLCFLCIDILPAFFYKGNWMVRIFIGCLFFTIQLGCEYFAWTCLTLLSGNMQETLDGHTISNHIQGVFLSKTIALGIVYFIASLKKENEYYGKQALLCMYLIFPLITTLSLNQMAYATEALQTVTAYTRFLWIAFFMITANIVLFFLFSREIKSQKLKQEIELLTLREYLQEEYYESLIKRDFEVSRINHDMKNHITVLKHGMEIEEFEMVKNYLEKLSTEIPVTKIYYTSHKMINAIINIKVKKAEEMGIKINTFIPNILPDLVILDMDLVIILANCIDNAIEAVEKNEHDKYVNLVIKSDEAGVSVMIENPILTHIKNIDLETTKKEKDKHGFGIKNVKAIVEKYSGTIQFEIQKNNFIVKIFLPNE